MKNYFLNVPQAFLRVFNQSGINIIPVTEIPLPDPQSTLIWYAKTEQDIMQFELMGVFARKIILASDGLILESPSITSLLLRQNDVEMYFPFVASNITQVLAPEKHWFGVKSQVGNNNERENLPILFSGSGKDSITFIGPPNTGKTSLILSLGAALALTKAKVLIVDTTNNNDLLYRIKLTDNTPPITLREAYDSLLNQKKLKLFQMADRLSILPGTFKNQLKSEEFHYVIDSIKSKYDFILFDCSDNPGELGRFALRIASRVLIVVNYDILPLVKWSEDIFEGLTLPKNKLVLSLNGSYPSKYQGRNTIAEYMQLPIIARIPASYNITMDAKIGFTIPYNIADDNYKESINTLMTNLWGIEKVERSTSRLRDIFNFKKVKGG